MNERPPVENYKCFEDYLQDLITAKIEANPSYSIRAFAKSIDVDTSTLSKILRKKRKIGKNALQSLCLKLSLDQDETRYFLEKIYSQKNLTPRPQSDEKYLRHDLDSFRFISDWYYYGILELMRLDDFVPEVEWIAKKLKLKNYIVQEAIERMARMEMIDIQDDKWVDLTGEKSSNNIDDKNTSTALRNLQEQLLNKSLHSLQNDPIEVRNHSSMTMAVDKEKIDEAKVLIKKFRREMAALMSSGAKTKNQVYNLSVSLFPISQEDKSV